MSLPSNQPHAEAVADTTVLEVCPENQIEHIEGKVAIALSKKMLCGSIVVAGVLTDSDGDLTAEDLQILGTCP